MGLVKQREIAFYMGTSSDGHVVTKTDLVKIYCQLKLYDSEKQRQK